MVFGWVLVYLPNKLAEETVQLCNYLACVLTTHKSVIVIGDFIMADIRWTQNAKQQRSDFVQQKFLQFCESWDLNKIVQKPTRKRNHLDIILTTHPERYGAVEVKPSPLSSVHGTVICCLQQSLKSILVQSSCAEIFCGQIKDLWHCSYSPLNGIKYLRAACQLIIISRLSTE